MDPELASNIKYFEHDRPPNTPRLSMEIEPSRVVSLKNPIGVIITIRRAEDDCGDPCIFRWDASHDGWGPSGFLLFQHTPDGLKKVEGKHESPSPQTIKLRGSALGQTQELPPGQTLRRNIGRPYPFWDHLVAGERYELFWPGAEYALWAWGTLREHSDQEIGVNLGLPRVVIPGGACCSLTCVEEQDPADFWPADPPVEKSSRIPGTPCISVSLQGLSTISKTESLWIPIKITYDGLTNEDCEAVDAGAKPIIIHDYTFYHDHFRLQRRCPDYDPSKNSDEGPPQWKTYYDERNEGWIMVDDPDVEVNVTDSDLFRSLQPGESFIERVSLDFFDLHPDTVVGDTYRYQYWGGCIDWWTWGDREEHANTVVKLPCWLRGNVVDPADNDGRPVIIVPASNPVEFTVVD